MDINEKNIINIIIVITVMTIIYYIFTSNNENFDSTISIDSIRDEVKNQYTIDVDSIRNLGAISKSLLTGTNYHSTTVGKPGTLTIPADNTVMNGNLIVDNINIVDRLRNLETQINTHRMPDGTSAVFVGNLNDPCPNGWVKTSNFVTKYNLDSLDRSKKNRKCSWNGGNEDCSIPLTLTAEPYEIITDGASILNLCRPPP